MTTNHHDMDSDPDPDPDQSVQMNTIQKTTIVYETPTQSPSQSTSSTDSDLPVSQNKLNQQVTSKNAFKAWNDKERNLILFTFSAISFISPLTTTIILPALGSIQNDFKATVSEGIALLTAYVICFGIFPLIWGPISDRTGRRKVAIIALSIFIITSILCAIAPTIYWLIVFRVCQAIGSSSGIVVGIGAIGDTYPPERRARAIALFSLGPIISPTLAPLLGGVIDQFLGWRAIFYITAALAIIVLSIMIIYGQETHPALRSESRGRMARVPIVSPIKFVLSSPYKSWTMFKTNPQVRSMATFAGLMFAYMYYILGLLPYILLDIYGYNSLQIGLVFIPFGLGLAVAIVIGGTLSDRLSTKDFIFKNDKFKNTRLAENGPIYARLLLLRPSLLIYLIAPPLIGWAFHFELSIIVYLFLSFWLGFGLTISRPSQLAYLYVQSPENPSTATGILYAFQFLVSGTTVQILSPLYGIVPIGLLLSIGSIWILLSIFLLRWIENDTKLTVRHIVASTVTLR